MLRDSAEYLAFLKFLRFQPLNYDKTLPKVTRTVGGAGPFDFSGAADPSAVPLTFKTDNGTPVTVNIDVSTGYGSVDESAVTVDEVVTAVTAESPTNITASKETGTLYIKFALTTPGTAKYLQVYGEAAEILLIGQGKTTKFVKADTGQSFNVTPTMKDSEELAIQDSNGKETTLLTDSYKKGDAAEMIDTANDYELRELIEGGVYDPVTETYEDPNSDTEKVYFMIEAFYARYRKGENKENDLIGYIKQVFRSCTGQLGASNHDRNFNPASYSIVATNYTDETGASFGSKYDEKLTRAEYDALHVDTV